MKNFFSFGNVAQEIELDNLDITLVLGQNNDALKDDDSGERRNGVGKSAIIQGLVFGLYGKSIGNDIKIPNLVNKTNPKYCEVIVDFEKDGVEYRIERGRNPTYFQFYTLDPNNNVKDDTRGESKDTQEDLNEILGISQLLFEYIVVMNANVEPFLSLPVPKQRDLIEELLGITQLTEKALILKEMQKENSKLAQQEKFKLETITESNKRIENSIEILQNQANEFESKKISTINNLKNELSQFDSIDFESLISLATKMDDAIKNNKNRENLEIRFLTMAEKCENYSNEIDKRKNDILKNIEQLKQINIDDELKNHLKIAKLTEDDKIRWQNTAARSQIDSQLKMHRNNIIRFEQSLEDENKKLIMLNDNKCPLCQNHLECEDTSIIDSITKTIETLTSNINDANISINKLIDERAELIDPVQEMRPNTVYKTLSEAQLHEHKLQELISKSLIEEKNIYLDEVISLSEELENTPVIEYENTIPMNDVKELQFAYNTLKLDLEREINSTNPYFSQIETLKTNSLKEVNYTEYNELSKLAEHQDFMVKLLMNKDSFVRKNIIEQNIQYLNKRLHHYISEVGSQHMVEFVNDLSVDINLNGQSYDFKQLSRGERTRVVLALNLAFRDVYEVTFGSINLLINDEIFDVGLDSHGVYTMWDLFKEYGEVNNKSIFIVSHREEALQRGKNMLLITKEDGFSTVEYGEVSDL